MEESFYHKNKTKKMENIKKKKKMEKLNEEREIRTDKEMIKRKCKIEKNGGKFEQRKRRKNRYSHEKKKERTKSRKRERLLGNFCHCIHACLSLKKKKKKKKKKENK